MDIQTALTHCLNEIAEIHPATTVRSYRNGLTAFRGYLETIKLTQAGELTMQHFIDYCAWLSQRRYSKKTNNVYTAAMQHFLDWLVLQNILQPSHSEVLRLTKAAARLRSRREKTLPRIPDKGDDDKMRQAAGLLPDVRDRAIIEFLFSSGCRRAEVSALRIKDLDLDERSAIVTGKGSKQRRVYYSPQAAELLAEYFKQRPLPGRTEPVFCRRRKGGHITRLPFGDGSIGDLVDKVCMLAGIDAHLFTAHSFRHAFAIRVLRQTKDLALVQDLLGHSDPNATRVYATIYPDELRDAHHQVFG